MNKNILDGMVAGALAFTLYLVSFSVIASCSEVAHVASGVQEAERQVTINLECAQ